MSEKMARMNIAQIDHTVLDIKLMDCVTMELKKLMLYITLDPIKKKVVSVNFENNVK